MDALGKRKESEGFQGGKMRWDEAVIEFVEWIKESHNPSFENFVALNFV